MKVSQVIVCLTLPFYIALQFMSSSRLKSIHHVRECMNQRNHAASLLIMKQSALELELGWD